jgi:hypothetical protein
VADGEDFWCAHFFLHHLHHLSYVVVRHTDPKIQYEIIVTPKMWPVSRLYIVQLEKFFGVDDGLIVCLLLTVH